ncbi:helix-turn-helix domain-containing protein [Flavobacterium psychrophilum]|uniref:helix-turn-helix domain-containing protein n=1 Tax=Flavobacterium psychrophilum TaxID=96345 RepID=UPI0036FBB5ED
MLFLYSLRSQRHSQSSTKFIYSSQSRVNEPSLSTLEKIAKALGVTLSDFFDTDDKLADVNSYDASIMEKIKLVEVLNDEEKKIVFSLVDALVGKKKLKDALSGVLNDVK